MSLTFVILILLGFIIMEGKILLAFFMEGQILLDFIMFIMGS